MAPVYSLRHSGNVVAQDLVTKTRLGLEEHFRRSWNVISKFMVTDSRTHAYPVMLKELASKHRQTLAKDGVCKFVELRTCSRRGVKRFQNDPTVTQKRLSDVVPTIQNLSKNHSPGSPLADAQAISQSGRAPLIHCAYPRRLSGKGDPWCTHACIRPLSNPTQIHQSLAITFDICITCWPPPCSGDWQVASYLSPREEKGRSYGNSSFTACQRYKPWNHNRYVSC